MEITITGYNGENVIAQLIEDLLSVNGLSVKRDEINPAYDPLSIDQLDRQILTFKKNKTEFTIKVIKEEMPKHLPKKMPKFKTNLPNMANLIRTPARMADVRAVRGENRDIDAGQLFVDDDILFNADIAPAPPQPGMNRNQALVDELATARHQLDEIRAAALEARVIGHANAIPAQEIVDEMPIVGAPLPVAAQAYEYVPRQWVAGGGGGGARR